MAECFDLECGRVAVEQIARICSRKGRILILMQNAPDPDSIASAAALREIVGVRTRKRAIVGYGGICGRAENRAMIESLGIDVRRVTSREIAQAATVALVDCQPRAGNNLLPARRIADIVIDHHLLPKRNVWMARFSDVRPEYGATSTILYEYLRAAEIPIKAELATALFYGIRSDTQDLGREVSPADEAAFQHLFPLADKRKLARIRLAPLPAAYFLTLRDGLSHCIVAGKAVVCRLDAGSTPDMMAEVADLLLRLEGIRVAVCYGLCDDTIHVSARGRDARTNVARHMKRIVSRLGTGGGHRTMAGGQIPVTEDPEKRLDLVHERILKTFAPHCEPRPLFQP